MKTGRNTGKRVESEAPAVNPKAAVATRLLEIVRLIGNTKADPDVKIVAANYEKQFLADLEEAQTEALKAA